VTADLELEHVTKRYGEVAAVRDVSFRVEAGEFVTLLGPSGGGKTSTLRIVAGFLLPDAGRVLLRGERVERVPPYERDIGMVFQSYALFPHMTVFDNVAFGLRMRRVGRRHIGPRVQDALALVRLDGYASRYPHQLSGGQQQRVVIAGALTLGPEVLVADEPVSSLDASVRGEILKLFLSLRDRLGLAALVVSHDLGLAWNIADRVAVMYLGRIVEVGTVEEVLLRPQHPYTRALLDAVPSTSAKPVTTALRGEPPDPTAIPQGCRFHPRCPLRATLPEDAAQQCLVDVPMLPPGVGERQVACFHVEAPHPEPAGPTGTRDPSEVTT
jgi:oligopeptide/dipeptide ABC transporter ATP-binding protein